MLWMVTSKEKMTKSKIFNCPFLGSHTSNLGKIPLEYIWPPGLPTHQISSNSEGVMCKYLGELIWNYPWAIIEFHCFWALIDYFTIRSTQISRKSSICLSRQSLYSDSFPVCVANWTSLWKQLWVLLPLEEHLLGCLLYLFQSMAFPYI